MPATSLKSVFVDIHTHRPTGRHIELRTAGIHPWEAAKTTAEQAIRELTAALDAGDVQAVGEIGLDFVRADTPEKRDAQTSLFLTQLTLARERQLPVVLHCVRAFEQTMRLLRGQGPPAVIFHGFIGSPEQARRAVERGYCLSFGERAFASPRTLEALRSTPLAQLFMETDESPTPIEEIYARAAAFLAVDVETLKQATAENYRHLFAPNNG